MKNTNLKTLFKALFLAVLIPVCLLASEEPANFYAEAKTDKKEICITFDDGPSKATVKLLDLLDKHRVKAVFFVLGVNADTYPESVKEVVKRGHELASHTYSHKNFYKSTGAEVKDKIKLEIKKANVSLEKITGVKPKLLRMPYGYAREAAIEAAAEEGMVIINWSFGYDWHKLPKEELIQKYCSALKPGAVLLFHDMHSNIDTRLEVIDSVITHALKEGYTFKPAVELFNLKPQ